MKIQVNHGSAVIITREHTCKKDYRVFFEHNIDVIIAPLLKTEFLIYHNTESFALEKVDFDKFSHIIVTSKNAVTGLFKLLDSLHKSLPPNCCFLTQGPVTAQKVSELFPSHLCRTQPGKMSEEFAEYLTDTLSKKDKVLFPHAEKTRPAVQNALRNLRISLTELSIYKTVRVPPIENILTHIRSYPCGSLYPIFFSPSAVDSWVSFPKLPLLGEVKSFCFGTATEHQCVKRNGRSPFPVFRGKTQQEFFTYVANAVKEDRFSL